MPRLALLLLFIIHALHNFKRFLSSLIPRRNPKPLLARRRRIPTHLALILVSDIENNDAREEEIVMEECIEQVIDWCKEIGVQRLSVFERDGVLSRMSRYASPVLSRGSFAMSEDDALKPPRGLMTPPLSDTDSRPRSPDIAPTVIPSPIISFKIPYLSLNDTLDTEKKLPRRRKQSQIFEPKPREHTLTVDFLSRQAGKPAVAAVACSLASSCQSTTTLTVQSLDKLMQEGTGLPPPDFIIVHSLHPTLAPLELYGFPPWQMQLSEIFYCPRRPHMIWRRDPTTRALALSEMDFRKALDQYASAEFRLGK